MEIATALCGSHVRIMELLQSHASPLFGRMTSQWQVEPFPFPAINAFFPWGTIEERVALFGIAGDVPAYLDWLDPRLALVENLLEVVSAR